MGINYKPQLGDRRISEPSTVSFIYLKTSRPRLFPTHDRVTEATAKLEPSGWAANSWGVRKVEIEVLVVYIS